MRNNSARASLFPTGARLTNFRLSRCLHHGVSGLNMEWFYSSSIERHFTAYSALVKWKTIHSMRHYRKCSTFDQKDACIVTVRREPRHLGVPSSILWTDIFATQAQWSLRVHELRRIEVFDTWCRRRILRISPLAHVTIAAIHEYCAVKAISDVLLQNRLIWFGHIRRRPEDALTSCVLNARPCP